jgi:hypothetical protein
MPWRIRIDVSSLGDERRADQILEQHVCPESAIISLPLISLLVWNVRMSLLASAPAGATKDKCATIEAVIKLQLRRPQCCQMLCGLLVQQHCCIQEHAAVRIARQR